MPLFVPFILGGAALISGLIGAKQGAKAAANLRQAKAIGEAAEKRLNRLIENFNALLNTVNREAAAYNELKIWVRDNVFICLVQVIQRLGKKASIDPVDLIGRLEAPGTTVRSYKIDYLEFSQGIASGLINAGVVGAGTAAGMVGLATTVGVASTGTAIATLSGAAAESAILAWFGGGSLAAGGLGIAGGSLVFGGVAVGPALLLTGLTLRKESEKQLTKAESYVKSVDEEIAKIKYNIGVLNGIKKRVNELTEIVRKLAERLKLKINELESIGTFDIECEEHLTVLQAAMQLASALREIINTPVLDETGTVNPETDRFVNEYGG